MNLLVGERWIRLSAAALASGNGRTYWSGYFADATQEQAQLDALATAKVQAELAANTKATFLATMSHEIRTPMSGLAGLLELLSRSGLAAEQRRMLELAIAAARSLRLLLDDILDFSRIESGRLQVETTDIRPRDLLCEVGLLMSGIAEQKGVGFECHIDARLAGILRGDGARIRQIVINLLSNAIKFTERGHVALRAVVVAEADGVQSWAVEVSDTGIGIPEDALAALFQPFVQAHSSAEARTSGSGLGLVIARRLAELMGGSVSLTSKVGRGTTARLDLHNTIVERDDTHVALIGKKVLLLCDDAIVHADIRADLSTLGMILVTDAADADVIMTDEGDGATGRPVVTLIMATPLATLSATQLSLACEPVLFTAVRDVCLRALGGDAPQSTSIDTRSELFHAEGNAPVVLVAEDDPTSQV
ncbi:MAG: ATP-binding protein, partial [Steroidobacteraceae bacterium]